MLMLLARELPQQCVFAKISDVTDVPILRVLDLVPQRFARLERVRNALLRLVASKNRPETVSATLPLKAGLPEDLIERALYGQPLQ